MQDASVHRDTLPHDVPTLQSLVVDLFKQIQSQQKRIEQFQAALDHLLRRRIIDTSNPLVPSLFGDPPSDAAPAKPEVTSATSTDASKPAESTNVRKKKGHGRNAFPENLERQQVIHELADVEKACPCCGETRVKIGEEVSEKLNLVPATLFVVEHVRVKYGCPRCSKTKAENVDQETNEPSVITTAPMPPSIIEKGLAEPGLLAHIIVNKYTDHLPLARQEMIFKRQGIRLSRKTMCDWMARCAEALRPIYDFMLKEVLKSKVIQCDETRVPVQDKIKVRSGRLWVYLGDRDHPYTVYDYRPTKARAGPEAILKTYQGYLQADAANVYDQIYDRQAIVEVGCWAHAIRHVREAESSDIALSSQAQSRIRELYRVERDIKAELEKQGLSGDSLTAEQGRLAETLTRDQRQSQSVPILASLKEWIETAKKTTLPKSPIHLAFNYIQNHWPALNRYVSEGFLNIDNNAAERGFRPIGIGRRNWLFAGSDAGGQTAATLFTLTQTCRTLDLNPWHYLKETFEKLPVTPSQHIANLLPRK
jgi:transposase